MIHNEHADPVRADAAPDWTSGGLGAAPVLIEAVRAVARDLYGEPSSMPDFVDWLFEDYFDESFDSAGEFLDYTLGESLSSDGQGGDASVAAVPFVAALAADDRVPDGARAHFLMLLLESGTTSDRSTVAWIDHETALGQDPSEDAGEVAARTAVQAATPALLARWDREVDICRMVLAALATLLPTHRSPEVGPRLDDIQAPAGSGRADVVALIRALITDIGTADAIEAVARWDSVTALGAATPADRRVVALSVLPHLIGEDVGAAAWRAEGQ